MGWTAPRTWVVAEIVTAALLNTHLRDNLLALSTHQHDGSAGEGDDELTGVDQIVMDDIAAPGSAPGASKSRVYSNGGLLKAQIAAATTQFDFFIGKFLRKTAAETVNNSATLQDDDDLTFAIGANEVWIFWVLLLHKGHGSAGLKAAFSAPAGAAGSYNARRTNSAGAVNIENYSTSLGGGFSSRGNLNGKAAMAHGVVRNGGTAGNFTVQWAQQTARASNTTLEADSYLLAIRVA